MPADSWFLTARERDNRQTVIDVRHPDGRPFTVGNEVVAHIDGADYFRVLRERVDRLRDGDLLLFTDWRGDPDERLGDDDRGVAQVFAAAARRGAVVKGLFWRSHWDKISYSEEENRSLADEINDAGGECLLDMRVRTLGSHHQKYVVLRHPGRPELDVAFVGGIDLCHTRNDTSEHLGDPQSVKMSKVYGPRPPWHDVQLEIRGPAVGDVEASFRERWNDPTALVRNPAELLDAVLHHDDEHADPLPEQLPDPAPRGSAAIQVLRTYPSKRPAFPFAPRGERSIARAYDKTIPRARSLVYIEDQFFWSGQVVSTFARALADNPELRVIVVLGHHCSQDGWVAEAANLVSRTEAIEEVVAAGGDRVAVYGIENHCGTPVYVHAKVCVVDDVWATVGSDNVNRRSWTYDSELTCAVFDAEPDEREPRMLDHEGDGARRFAREIRLRLAREHLDRGPDDVADLIEPVSAFDAFRRQALALQAWHDGGRTGQRPPGRVRPYQVEHFHGPRRWVGKAVYRVANDPDGRPFALRRRNRF